jgi:hypothetical protein
MKLTHIYNGNIESTPNIKLVEFKISNSTGNNIVFNKSKYHCSWFIETDNDKELIPVLIDTESIKQGKRIIKDNDHPELNGLEIKINKNKINPEITTELESYIINNFI